MKTRMLTLAAAVALAAAHQTARAETWDFTQPDAARFWILMGRTQQTEKGLAAGPSQGDYAISGVVSKQPLDFKGAPEIEVAVSGMTVTNAAPDDLENENDTRLNIALSPAPSPVWESGKEAVNARLLLNSRNGGLYFGVFGKGAGRQYEDTALLTEGAYLGDGSGFGELKVRLKIAEQGVTASVERDGEALGEITAPLPAELRGLLSAPLHAVIYQQNIGSGSGEAVIRSVAAR